jgi:hypothetical protein
LIWGAIFFIGKMEEGCSRNSVPPQVASNPQSPPSVPTHNNDPNMPAYAYAAAQVEVEDALLRTGRYRAGATFSPLNEAIIRQVVNDPFAWVVTGEVFIDNHSGQREKAPWTAKLRFNQQIGKWTLESLDFF